jgi:hypothetical protein
MKLQPSVLPTPEELARLLGLSDLRLGRHFLRSASGELTGSVSVGSLWYGEVIPSFQPRFALAMVAARGELSREGPSTGFLKAVMANPEASHVLTVNSDPMVTALNQVDLFCDDQAPPTQHGIAYTLTFQTLHLQGTLQFGSPIHPCLQALEDALLGLAERIAADSGNAQLREVVAACRAFNQGKSA